MIGFEVRGRHGALGVVSEVSAAPWADGPDLVVVGGTSSHLRFHVPLRAVTALSPTSHTLEIDADIVDFAPKTFSDGYVDLFVKTPP